MNCTNKVVQQMLGLQLSLLGICAIFGLGGCSVTALVIQLRKKIGTLHWSHCTFVGAVMEMVFTQRLSQIQQTNKTYKATTYKAQYNTPNHCPRYNWGSRLVPTDLQTLCTLSTATLLLAQRFHQSRNH